MRATTVACRRGDRARARSMRTGASLPRVALAMVALIASILTPAGSLRAQTVHGTVLDETNDIPVPGASMELLTRSGNRVSESIANDLGRFALKVPEAGEYFLHVQRLGYEPMTSLLLEIGVDRNYDLELAVRPAPLPIGDIRVTVRGEQVRLWVRQIVGMDPSSLSGKVVMGEELERIRESSSDIVSMMRWAHLAATVTYSFDKGVCVMARAMGCAKVMLDGAPFPLELFDTIDPYTIGAIVFLRPIDSGILFGSNLGRSGTLLLFSEGYVSREQTP